MRTGVRVVVTGSRGFMGKHLVRRLAEEGAEIRRLTWDLDSGSAYEGIPLGVWDGEDPAAKIPSHWKGEPFTLIDLAWDTARPPQYGPHAGQVARLSSLLDGWTPLGLSMVIGVGTAEEYGNRAGILGEEDGQLGTLSAYGWGKAAARELLRNWSLQSGRAALWLRPFVVYGAEQKGNMLLPYAIRQALSGQQARFSDGQQERDFIHVSDVVEAIVRALESPPTGFEVVNIGTGVGVKVRDVLLYLEELLGTNSFRIGDLGRRPGEPAIQVANTAKASRLWNWSARTSWRDGLRQLVEGL
jgi:nucleoside-diphosphate-sugar epimerase